MCGFWFLFCFVFVCLFFHHCFSVTLGSFPFGAFNPFSSLHLFLFFVVAVAVAYWLLFLFFSKVCSHGLFLMLDSFSLHHTLLPSVCSWLSFLSAFLFVSLLFETGSHCVILAGLQMPCRTGWTKHTLCLLSAEIKSQKNQARCLGSVFCFVNFVFVDCLYCWFLIFVSGKRCFDLFCLVFEK